MRRLLIVWLACALSATPAWSEPPSHVPLDPAPGVYEIGDFRFVYSVVVDNDGHTIGAGSLFRDGLPIAGGPYYRLELPIGSFIWYPATEGRGVLGWTRINPSMKHSQWSMALIEAKPGPKAKVLRTYPRDPIPAAPIRQVSPPPTPDPNPDGAQNQ